MNNSLETSDKPLLVTSALYYIGAFLLLLALISPILVFVELFTFPFITSKVFFFRAVTFIAFICTILLLYIEPKFRIRVTISNVAGIVFGVSLILSALFGVDFLRSWWSGHERMLGVFSVLHYIAYGAMLPIYFRTFDATTVADIKIFSWNTWFKILLAVASVVAVTGFMQHWGSKTFLFVEPGGRVFGTLGNFIYFGNFMSTMLWIIALLIIHTTSNRLRIFYILFGIMAFVGLFISGSRGALLGTLSALFITLILVMFRGSRKYRIRAGISVGALIFFVVLIFASPFSNYIKRIEGVGRIIGVLSGSGPRLIAWKVAYESWKEHPVFGWGFENFYVAFNKYFDPRSQEYSLYETWFDNAHNIILNTLTTTGIIGLISYLGLYAVALYMIFSLEKKKHITFSHAFVLVGFLFADLGSKLFVFDHPTSYMVLFGMLGYITSLWIGNDEVDNQQKKSSRFLLFFVYATTILFGFWILFSATILPAITNHEVLSTMKSIRQDPKRAVLYIGRVFKKETPHKVDVVIDIARDVSALSNMFKNILSKDEYITLLNLVDNELTAVEKISPLDIQIYMATADIARLKLAYDKTAFSKLQESYSRALSLSPKRLQLYYLISRSLFEYGMHDEALKIINDAIVINPRVSQSYWLRAYLNYSLKKESAQYFEDLYMAIENLVFVPQSINELDVTSQMFLLSGYPRFEYDMMLLRKYASGGQKAPQNVFIRLADTFETIGLYELRRAVEERAIANDYSINIIIASKKGVDISKLKDMIKRYEKNDKIPPYQLYLALLFGYGANGDIARVSDTIQQAKTLFRPNYAPIFEYFSDCLKKNGYTYENFDSCLVIVGG